MPPQGLLSGRGNGIAPDTCPELVPLRPPVVKGPGGHSVLMGGQRPVLDITGAQAQSFWDPKTECLPATPQPLLCTLPPTPRTNCTAWLDLLSIRRRRTTTTTTTAHTFQAQTREACAALTEGRTGPSAPGGTACRKGGEA